MIVTVTPNPSIDMSFTVDRLRVGEVNRATTVRRDPAGKGVNVARALSRNGVATTALFPADAYGGQQLARLLSEIGVPAWAVPIGQAIRNNVTILDQAGTTKLNEAGPPIAPDEAEGLLSAIRTLAAGAPDWLVLSGSTPPGIGPEWCVAVGRLAGEHGIPFAADLSGANLAAVVAAGVATVIKPNQEELEGLIGTPVRTVGDVVAGGRTLLRHSHSRALVSLGEHGAILVAPTRSWWAGAPAASAISTVGAGDCTLAGYLSDGSADDAMRLARGVAWGSAAVMLPGTQVPGPEKIRLGRVDVIAEPNPDTEIGELAK